MSVNKKLCALILPYFGRFNNYFQLFLDSCGENHSYNWLIFTDNNEAYRFPENVQVIKCTLDDVKKIAQQKFGHEVCLNNPYKLCDYKPAYGFLFEEYIGEYEYWGHCDCDLIFGNLDKLLTPILRGYDKCFAAGYLTIYKNNFQNNRRFMNQMDGRCLYREAFTSNNIFVFDEDFKNHENVHTLFINDNAVVYETDLSMNAAISSAKYIRSYYDSASHGFKHETYKEARYYWKNGDLFRIMCNGNELYAEEFIYMHFQLRKMRYNDTLKKSVIEILPDRFRIVNYIPQCKKDMRFYSIGFPYLYWWDVYIKKVRRRLLRK